MSTMFDIPPIATSNLFLRHDLWRPSKFWQEPERIQCSAIPPLQLPIQPLVDKLPILELGQLSVSLKHIPPLINDFTIQNSTSENSESADETVDRRYTASKQIPSLTSNQTVLRSRVEALSPQSEELLQSCEALYHTAEADSSAGPDIEDLHSRVKLFEHNLQCVIANCAASLNSTVEAARPPRAQQAYVSAASIRAELRQQIILCGSAPNRYGPPGSTKLDVPILRAVDARYPSLALHGHTLSLCRKAVQSRGSKEVDGYISAELDHGAARSVFGCPDLRKHFRHLGDLALLLDGNNIVKLKEAWSEYSSVPERFGKTINASRLLLSLNTRFGASSFMPAKIRGSKLGCGGLRLAAAVVPALPTPSALRYLLAPRHAERLQAIFSTLSQLVYLSDAVARSRISRTGDRMQPNTRSRVVLRQRMSHFLDSVLLHAQSEILQVWSILDRQIESMVRNPATRSLVRLRQKFSAALDEIEARLFLGKGQDRASEKLKSLQEQIALIRESSLSKTGALEDEAIRKHLADFDETVYAFTQQLTNLGAVPPPITSVTAFPCEEHADEEDEEAYSPDLNHKSLTETCTTPSTHLTCLLLALTPSNPYLPAPPAQTPQTTPLAPRMPSSTSLPPRRHKRAVSEIYEDCVVPAETSAQRFAGDGRAIERETRTGIETKGPFCDVGVNAARLPAGRRVGLRTRSAKVWGHEGDWELGKRVLSGGTG